MSLTLAEPAAPETPAATRPATWYYVQGFNDCYWRVETPAKAIGARLNRIPEETGGRDLLQPNTDGAFQWAETQEGSVYPQHEGAAVFTRPCQIRAIHALSMREQGVRISAELDDNYLTSGKFNLSIRQNYDPLSATDHMKALLPFDAVIFSTRWLRDNYYKQYRKHMRARPKHLPEFHVCGNHVDPDHWPERNPMRADGRLRVGWMGSPSHLWDLKLLYPALLEVSRAGHEVVLIGYDPHWRPNDPAWGQGGFKPPEYTFEYTFVPWVDPNEYGRPKVGLPLDIGLCPLRHDEFNLGRSDVKALEYGISGAAVVASRTVYGEYLAHGETVLLGQSREELMIQTMRLVNDDSLRERMAGNLAQYIREERLIHHHKHEWEQAVLG